MKRLVPLALAALLLVGCEEAAVATSTPEVTANASVPAPSASSTPGAVMTFTPPPRTVRRSWDRPPATGIAHVDAIVAALVAQNVAALEPYITGLWVPCGVSQHPACVPGTMIESGHCPGGPDDLLLVAVRSPGVPDRSTTPRETAIKQVGSPLFLSAVYGVQSGTAHERGIRYRLVFVSDKQGETGRYFNVTDSGVSGYAPWIWQECAAPRSGETILVAPPP